MIGYHSWDDIRQQLRFSRTKHNTTDKKTTLRHAYNAHNTHNTTPLAEWPPGVAFHISMHFLSVLFVIAGASTHPRSSRRGHGSPVSPRPRREKNLLPPFLFYPNHPNHPNHPNYRPTHAAHTPLHQPTPYSTSEADVKNFCFWC